MTLSAHGRVLGWRTVRVSGHHRPVTIPVRARPRTVRVSLDYGGAPYVYLLRLGS